MPALALERLDQREGRSFHEREVDLVDQTP
jgi:hypothetical protein